MASNLMGPSSRNNGPTRDEQQARQSRDRMADTNASAHPNGRTLAEIIKLHKR